MTKDLEKNIETWIKKDAMSFWISRVMNSSQNFELTRSFKLWNVWAITRITR